MDSGFWGVFAATFGLLFVAEIGDKTQLTVLALAARRRPLAVLGGAAAAFALLTLLAVVVGAAIAEVAPVALVKSASGLLFLVFGLLALRESGKAETVDRRNHRHPALEAFVLILGAEFLDKSQLATASLASGGHPIATGLASFLALMTSSVLAVATGGWLAKRVPAKFLRWGAGGLFLAVGFWLLGTATWQLVGHP